MIEKNIVQYELDYILKNIYTLRGVQIMLDNDLAHYFNIETKRLNQQVKRNIERFPAEFMFQLTEKEFESLRLQNVTSEIKLLRSQNATLEDKRGKHRKYLPFAFTEQGVAMLSAVLRSDTAVKVSIQIMKAFVNMRRFILSNAELFNKINIIERRQIISEIESDKKFEQIFNAIQSKEPDPKQGVFFEGQIFDAFVFINNLIRKANKSIVLIDNYIDDTVLTMLAKKKNNVSVTIFTKSISNQLKLDIEKFNSQYPKIDVKLFNLTHDRFLIIDEDNVYHIGASMKDLGKKWFAFSKLEKDGLKIIDKLKEF